MLLQCDCKLQVQVSFSLPFLSFAHSNGLRLKGVLGPWLGLAALSNTSAQSVSRITITQLYVSRVTWRDKRTFSFFFFKTPFNCNLDTETFELQSEHFLRWLEPVDPNLCRTPPQIRSFGILSLRRHGIVFIWFEPLDERHEEYNNILCLVTWTNYLPRKRKGWAWAREWGPGAEVVGCIVAHKTV